MIDWLITNWQYILFAALVVLATVYAMMTGKVNEWLKYAVTEAEIKLGSGTGQLKLRRVYDMFIDKFPAFSTIVPFPIFSAMVDNALKWLAKQLDQNPNVKSIIENQNAI